MTAREPQRSAQRPSRTRRGQPAGEATCRRIGNLSLLLPPARPPATGIDRCLDGLQQQWQREGHLAALWQRWPALAGPQLAGHCQPLRLQGSRLTVGAAPGPWLQALQYHRHQLLGALRAAGFPVRELRVEQHHPAALARPALEEEEAVWAVHPSRADVHGMATCPRCGAPAPAGEMARWGHCSFCRRRDLAPQ